LAAQNYAEIAETMTCPFCSLPKDRIIAQNDCAVAIADESPVNPGHTLVIPRRHVESWFDTDEAERQGILRLVDELKSRLDAEHGPDAWNIGINDGLAAGQTIMHLHIHLIPRYSGDVDDPRGGVRHVIPERGNYKRPGHVPKAKCGD
jgi:diadenosine tetraphosphate (Ap4A) HIT family hydrolase